MISLRKKRTAQAGNALIYVLIGIVLFAALNFFMTKTNQTTGQMSAEDAHLNAQSIISFAEKVNGAVESVMLQNGCSVSQVSFENATVAGYANGNSPASKKCDIFNLSGGGLTYEPPSAKALDAGASGALVGQYLFTGTACVDKVGTGTYSSCAAGNEELLLVLPFVNADTCNAVNQILGNKGAMLVDSDGSFGATKFTGSFTPAYAIGAAGAAIRPVGCYQATGAASPGAGYHFYMVLQAR